MSQTTRFALFAALVVCLGFFGWQFYAEFKEMPARQAEEAERTPSPVTAEPTNSLATSNPSAQSNLLTTNVAATANATSAPALNSNVVASVPPPVAQPPKYRAGRMLGFGGLFVVSVVLFGVMLAREISHFVAHRTHEYVLTDEHVASKPADYERAEQLWANGEFLDAIQMLRDMLKRQPHDLFIARRIAEIYEKDLQNPLAAALEYEEILAHKFDPELWGWDAIHLANLYSGKLKQPDKAMAWLKRIDAECGETASAKKARERLGKTAPASVEPAENGGSFKLPPGFRPKQG